MEAGQKIKEIIQKNTGFLTAALVSIIFVASSIITIGKTGKSVHTIIVDGAVSFFMSLFLGRLLTFQGLINGERDEKYLATAALHGEMVVKISPHIERLDAWCEKKTASVLREGRTNILVAAGMKYDDYFDEFGRARDFVVSEKAMAAGRRVKGLRAVARIFSPAARADYFLWKHEEARMRAYRRALKFTVTPLSSSVLTGNGQNGKDPYRFNHTKAGFVARGTAQNMISKIAVAVLSGYYGIELIQNFSFANLIWKALQIAFIAAMAVVEMYRAHYFITDEYRGETVKKIDLLQMFDNECSPRAGEEKEIKEDMKYEHDGNDDRG